MSDISYSTDISFVCPSCSVMGMTTLDVPDVPGAKRSDPQHLYVICPTCDDWIKAEVVNMDGDAFVVFPEDPTRKVICTLPYGGRTPGPDEPMEDVERPDQVFAAALAEGDRIITDVGSSLVSTAINRMVFNSYYAAFEAFLSDSLLKLVAEDSTVMARLIAGDKDLKEVKIPLTRIMQTRDIVLIEVTNHLRGLIFHNFAKIEVLFKIATGGHLFPDSDIKTRLMQSLDVRHDCVHRNGRTLAGEERSGITREYVRAIGKDMRSVVEHVTEAISARRR